MAHKVSGRSHPPTRLEAWSTTSASNVAAAASASIGTTTSAIKVFHTRNTAKSARPRTPWPIFPVSNAAISSLNAVSAARVSSASVNTRLYAGVKLWKQFIDYQKITRNQEGRLEPDFFGARIRITSVVRDPRGATVRLYSSSAPAQALYNSSWNGQPTY